MQISCLIRSTYPFRPSLSVCKSFQHQGYKGSWQNGACRCLQIKASESHLYGASPPVHWLSDMTAFQTDHRNERIPPHFTKHTVMETGEDKTLKQRQALERLWLIPSPFVTIFKNSWLVSTKQHFQDTKVSFMTAICSSLLQLPEGLSRMSVTEGQVHSWDPTPGQSSRNRTKPWVKTQTLCLDTSTKCLPNSSALHSVTQTHRGWLLPSEVYSLTAIAQPTYRDMKGFTEVTKGVSGRRRHQMWAAAVSLSSACPLNFAVC